jgi:lipopolysaccharide biosynthesis glycosyltransferase
MKKVIAVTLSLVFLWFVSSPQSVYADTNNKLKTKPINIAFCFNENLWMQVGVTITSLLCTAEEKCCYNIYCVVPASMNQTKKNILKAQVKKYSPLSMINFLTVTNQLDSVEPAENRATCYRLLLPNLLPDVDKVIYTDIDVIFNDDLQELDKIDISKYYVAGVRDFYKNDKNLRRKTRKIYSEYGLYDISDKGQYINAGVLILNLKKIRQDDIDKKWFELINIDFPYIDQDIINITCAGNILLLPYYYNLNHDSARIIHYAGSGSFGKPWEVNSKIGSELWWYYAGQTPFAPCFIKNVMQKQHENRFKVLPKRLSRVFCWFIPKKESRHKFRRKYMVEEDF